MDYGCALGIERHRERAKLYLCSSLITNLSILFFFKYFNFFQGSVIRLFGALGWEADPISLHIILPVGISFYTFQSLSYVVDVYRKQTEATRSLPTYALYISFFPQLIAGPIERSYRLLPQFLRQNKLETTTVGEAHIMEGAQGRRASNRDILTGLELIALGLFKKVVVADTLGTYSSGLISPEQYPGFEMLLGMYAFSIQVYGDFSGYSDIARGSARLFGIHLMVNFNQPFLSENIQDFWGRWHISLSEWIKNYLFFPLMRSSWLSNKTSLNVFLAMLITGIWHGAGFKYILFGVYHGLLLVCFENTRKLRKKIRPPKGTLSFRLYQFLCRIFTFHLVVVAFSIFGCQYSQLLPAIYSALLKINLSNFNGISWLILIYFSIPLYALQSIFDRHWSEAKSHVLFKLVYFPSLIFIILSIGLHGVFQADPFIYFQF